ncbi:protease HtpX [Algiphilus aromaticivorans]|jgi:heat shock protein HtpX|uniref:protease HtpX n=1 Tax=Algiphilus aromaticivorans TaxID=382454 RepID=UPI0005C16D58|nr:protease HtpX [Algiphilus aromaticivorans]
MKRIFLFLATNIAILVVLSIAWFVISSVFGLDPMHAAGGGLNHGTLLVFATIFGFGGAFISLWLSKPIAKWSTGAKVIDKPSNSAENWLLSTVQRQARQAGIGMPEVAIFDSPEPNAFATGATKNRSMVAVSTGLLQNMKQDEVEAVLGHEVSHIANGDMVTLTLIQGVLNTFVIFLSRVIGHFIDRVILKNDSGMGIGYFVSVIVMQIILGIAAAAVVCWFSRKREFRADTGGAQLAGRRKMVDALARLQSYQGGASTLPDNMAAFGIRGGAMARVFSTHPPLEERIAALQKGA